MKFILFHILTTLPLFVVGNTNINDELAKLNLQMAEMKENLHSLKKSIWDLSTNTEPCGGDLSWKEDIYYKGNLLADLNWRRGIFHCVWVIHRQHTATNFFLSENNLGDYGFLTITGIDKEGNITEVYVNSSSKIGRFTINTQMIFLTLTYENNEGAVAMTNPRFRLSFNSEASTFSPSAVDVFQFQNITGRHYYPPDFSYGRNTHFVAVLNPREDTEYRVVERYVNGGVDSFFQGFLGKAVKGHGVVFERVPKNSDPEWSHSQYSIPATKGKSIPPGRSGRDYPNKGISIVYFGNTGISEQLQQGFQLVWGTNFTSVDVAEGRV